MNETEIIDFPLYDNDRDPIIEYMNKWKGQHIRNWFRYLFDIKINTWIVIHNPEENPPYDLDHLHLEVSHTKGFIPQLDCHTSHDYDSNGKRCGSYSCSENSPEMLYKKVRLLNGGK